MFARRTPGIPVLGEEQGGEYTDGPLWVVDPLDGTTNFVLGFPFYAVSIALQNVGRSDVGVVIDAVRGHEYTARRGHGAFRDTERLAVSDTREFSRALVGTGFPYDRTQRAAYYLQYVERVLTRAGGIRRAGAAALDLAMIAEGALDAYWEFNLAIWDVAAGVLLVEEAGGTVTGTDGGRYDRVRPSIIAANPHLHPVLLGLLQS